MKVLVQFVQDRSGSMATVWTETVSGFKTFVEELRLGAAKESIDYFLTLTTFDTLIESPLHEKALSEVTGNEFSELQPRGSTALYDAVGKTIEATKQDGYDKILTVIVTDGQENSSREWSKDALQKIIEAKISLGNWTFTYLGTQPETWDEASSLGVGAGASATYNAANAGQTYRIMASRTTSMASSSLSGTRSFLSDDKFGNKQEQDDMVTVGMDVSGAPRPNPSPGLAPGGIPVVPPPKITVTPPPPKAKTPDKRKWR